MIEPDNLTPPPPKKHFGRFLLWAALVGGLCLFLFLVLLVAVTTPNLRREAAPPEISGPKQRERLSGASDSPTSKALPPSGGVTSGTHPLLNLDEFPYLSPKMRELAQAWLDQSAETDRALDSVADPVLHARIAAFLKGRGAKMRTFLNFPLEWGDQPFQKTLDALALYRFSNRDETDTEAWKQILLQCPEFADVFEKERGRSSVLKFRLSFEFCAERQHWNSAAEWCAAADRMSHLDYPDLAPLRDMNGWDEEIYCWRQMGPTGLAALTARSYQRALDERMGERPGYPFYHRLRMAGDVVVWSVLMRKSDAEDPSDSSVPEESHN